MFLGAGEIVVVLAVALMVLGPKKMPEVARKLARFVAQVRRMTDEVRSQVDDALHEPPRVEPPQLSPLSKDAPDHPDIIDAHTHDEADPKPPHHPAGIAPRED